MELARIRLERTSLEVETSLARSRLSLLWGDLEPRFERLLGTLDSLPAPPGLDSLAVRAEASPVLTRWRAEREARRTRLVLERARRIPDLLASAGLRSLGHGNDRTLVASLSVPLSLFDRNHGPVEEAAATLEQASLEEAQARLEMRSALAERHATLRRARAKLESLRQEVLPEAERAFGEMRLGFELGRFTYLDLLETRRTWIRARQDEIQALLAGHLAVAELERLMGGPLRTSNHEGGSGR